MSVNVSVSVVDTKRCEFMTRCEWAKVLHPCVSTPLYLFNPLWGMKEGIIISLSISLLSSLFLSLFLSPYVEPPWEGGGAILGTTPHPAMILNTIIISVFHYQCHHPSRDANHFHLLNIIITLTLKSSTIVLGVGCL